MRRFWRALGTALLGLGLSSFSDLSLLRAGGPATVGPNGSVIRWNRQNPDTFPIRFSIDQGSLGPVPAEQATELVRDAFGRWAAVDSAELSFADLGLLDVDISGCDPCQAPEVNYRAFFDNQERPENPVVFDDDGSIIDAVLGSGSSKTVLGFAEIRFIEDNEYRSARVVLNGLQASTSGNFPQVVTHEIGHLLGLDHTQINSDLAFNAQGSDDALVPMMFPLVLEQPPPEPVRDDRAWISRLYPGGDFASSTGTIRGRISRRCGGAFQGANVVAVRLEADGSESRQEVVSAVSDFLRMEEGSYELPGLVPGEYRVFIEPLNALFTGGSGVGPFDSRFTDFDKDYYNGSGESGSGAFDDPSQKSGIPVAARQMVRDIDLISNERANQLSTLGDDDLECFEFGDGFTFPFFGREYREVVVNSDGNLTFGAGDASSSARSEARFLSGPPRIAPLFTDLNPEQGGQITAVGDERRVTFSWEEVPEFSEGAAGAGNTFSVTLFSNGDVLFRYQAVEVTPDGPTDTTQAVVGIGPGGLMQGSSSDLSSQGGVVRLAGGPLYEVFREAGFDLANQAVLFQAASNELLFPFVRGDDQNFSGFAVTNFSGQRARIQLERRGADGGLQPFPSNPRPEEVGVDGQLARLGRELFGIPEGGSQSGWVRMTSNTPQLASFFQFGNGLGGPLTKMDGSVALREPAQVLFFTRIFEGVESFSAPGGGPARDAQTFLSLANPNNQTIILTLQLFDSQGRLQAPVVRESLVPFGRFFDSVASIFNISGLSDGYVRVDVEGPGAVGFALIELEDTLLGLNGAPADQAVSLYSAQLANGTASGSAVFTSLKLVNTSPDERTCTLTAFREDGTVIGSLEGLALEPGATLQQGVDALFGLGPPTAETVTTGSLQVEVDGPGVIGDVVFGDPRALEFAAVLPLQSRRFREAVFSQVANGPSGSADPSLINFTGVALFNPDTAPAEVTLAVFDPAGRMIGEETRLPLGPAQRVSDLVANLIPGTADLRGGYIRMRATVPVVAQQLFGNMSLQFLSAVPPTIIE